MSQLFKEICTVYNSDFTKAESRLLTKLKGDNHLTDKELATQLGVSVNTVKTHLKNIYRKSNICGRNSRFRLFKNDNG